MDNQTFKSAVSGTHDRYFAKTHAGETSTNLNIRISKYVYNSFPHASFSFLLLACAQQPSACADNWPKYLPLCFAVSSFKRLLPNVSA